MKPLTQMDPGEALQLERISEELELDAEMMDFLDRSGIRPGAVIRLDGRDPHGALTAHVDGSPVGIGRFASERLFVSVLSTDPAP